MGFYGPVAVASSFVLRNNMQIIFESCYDESGNKTNEVSFLPNWDILPNYEEIDAIIGRLERLKKEMTDEEIVNHNLIAYGDSLKDKEEWNKGTGKYKKEKKLKQEGYIYLIKSDKFYKIGRAKKPKERMKTYKTENPNEIEVILCEKVENYIEVEKDLLKIFDDQKYRGEWFELSVRDINQIKSYLIFSKS